MVADLLILDHTFGAAGARLKLTGKIEFPSDTFTSASLEAITLALTYKDSTDLLETDLVLDSNKDAAVKLPLELLRKNDDGIYRLVNKDDIEGLARHEVEKIEARRQELKDKLADPILINLQSGVFGVTNFDRAEIRIPPTILDLPPNLADETVLFGLKARKTVTLALPGNRFRGDFRFGFEVRKKDLADIPQALFGAFDIEVPAFPAFDLNLPRFHFPTLSLDGLNLPLRLGNLDWPAVFPISIPKHSKWPIKARWAGNENKVLKVTANGGQLTLLAENPGTVEVTDGTTVLLNIEVKKIGLDGGEFAFEAEYSGHSGDITLDAVTLPDWVPLEIQLEKSTLELQVTKNGSDPAEIELTHDLPKITIRDREDPSTLLRLTMAVTYSASESAPSDITTRVTRLKILSPYPIDLLLGTVDAVGDALRLLANIPLPDPSLPNPEIEGLKKVLELIIDLLGAAARWLTKQAEAIGKILAGVAEAIADAIKALFRNLSSPNPIAFKYLTVEVRLDPKTYRLEKLILMPAGAPPALNYKGEFLGFELTASGGFRPAMVLNFEGEDWFGLALLPTELTSGQELKVTLATDLWLKRETGPTQPLGTLPATDDAQPTPPRLVQVNATALEAAGRPDRKREIVLAAIQNGKVKLFQSVETDGVKRLEVPGSSGSKHLAVGLGRTGPLEDAKVYFGDGNAAENDVLRIAVTADTTEIKKRALTLLPKSSGDGHGASDLVQLIKIEDLTYKLEKENRSVELDFGLQVRLTEGLAPKANLRVAVSLRDFSAKITGGDRIAIMTEGTKSYEPLGLMVKLAPKKGSDDKNWEVFVLDLSLGAERFALGKDADATVAYRRVSTSGQGLVFQLSEFAASRAGFDLEASVKPDNPVTLGGVDVPFRFTSGALSISRSQFKGASLAGSGQLPPALIGEANASIAMQLGRGADGDVEVLGATARLDKSGDPIRCNATQFELTITELGFDYVRDGAYHFYFLLTGSAVFRPTGGFFDNGLLKNFKELEIKLDKAPLGGDPRVLLRSISFLISVDPPKRTNFFDLFAFDLKGIGFFPAAEKFNGDPAMAISGQVKFAEFGDKVSPRFDFHKMWIAGPAKNGFLPRVRFDGLTVGLKTGALDVEATAIAVDDGMPDLYRPDVLPADVRAEGFLAKGRLDISGWASMSGAMGFLQLTRRDVSSDPRHAFFIYGQMNKLTEPIDTPVGRIYLREFGFGMGYRYTLAGIAQAQTAKNPKDLIRILDDIRKYQGNLDQFEAWEPTYDNNDLTLALRGMFSIAAASTREEYNEKAEKGLPNPLLFDIVAALRTDLTFLINLRGWIAVNYNDWVSTPGGEPFKSNPTMGGYLYFSVPRKEYLARMISEPGGHVGQHPKLPKPLVDAIQAVRFSSILYIRPGLFHMEFGWPYELGFDIGRKDEPFYLSVRGGLINRIEDFSLLYGMAFRADGGVKFGGRVGSDNFGASATAQAIFSLEAKILAHMSLQRFGDALFYGILRFDMTMGVSVSVWVSFKVFRKRIRLSVGFSLHLAVSIALEAVITPNVLGARAHVAVGVRAFGRTLSIGIGLSFNDGALNQARARVARFMALGLTADIPPPSEDGRRAERAPRPDAPRQEVMEAGDDRLDHDIGTLPAPPPATGEDDEENFKGRPLDATHFWAMLFPISGRGDDEIYLMQLVPRDGTLSKNANVLPPPNNTFFASPTPGETYHELRGDSAELNLLKRVEIPAAANSDLSFDEVAPGLKLLVDTDAEVAKATNDTRALLLGDVLTTLFLNERNGDEPPILTEPVGRMIEWEDRVLPQDREASANELGRIGRSREHLIGQPKREAEIEESRSAVIAAVMESAEQVARALGANVNPARIGEIDARDFGLTFQVTRKDLAALFSAEPKDGTPQKAKFDICKSDAINKPGDIHLFNPPHRMFRDAQPRLNPRHDLTSDGIKLDWDLEPAWGGSQTIYDDPEFHLKHYRIKRRIVGAKSGTYEATFDCKAAAPTEFLDNEGRAPIARTIRPPYQFVDDLRMQDAAGSSPARPIPDDVRNAILGLSRSDMWADDLRVEYEIQPIDIAGTTEFGESYTVRRHDEIFKPPVSPLEATIQLVYAGLPTLTDKDAEPDSKDTSDDFLPAIRFLLKRPPILKKHKETDPDYQDDDPSPGNSYQLRVFRDRAVPSGGYGSDAVTQAKTRPGQDQIESMEGNEVSNFTLKLGKVISTDQDNQESHSFVIAFDEEEVKNEQARFVAELLDGSGKSTSREALLEAIHGLPYLIKGEKIEPTPGRSARIFLRAEPSKLEHHNLFGEWRSVTPNIVALGKLETEDKADKVAIDTMVETFEQPVALSFRALERADMAVRSGRLHIFHPGAQATLNGLLKIGGTDAVALELAADPRRRTATKLSWNARPKSLALAGKMGAPRAAKETDLFRWVSGFEVFRVDPDMLVGDAGDPNTLAHAAENIGTVRLLPASERGLSPDRFGDFSKLECTFPSAAWRESRPSEDDFAVTAEIARAKPRKPWFSLAESSVIFPRPRIRRTVFPDLDESLIAELFTEGRPDYVEVCIPAWRDVGSAPLRDWRLRLAGPSQGDDDRDKASDWKLVLTPSKDDDGFKVKDLRKQLRQVILAPRGDRASAEEIKALEKSLSKPGYLGEVTIEIRAWRLPIKRQGVLINAEKARVTSTVAQSINLLPPLHPVLADTLARLAFHGEDLSRAYRRYSVVADETPPSEAVSFMDYLDEMPPERDPHGFSALRTLGLAFGFQLYDTEKGTFLRGRDLCLHVEKAFKAVLEVYGLSKPAAADGGLPFLDILTRPWGNGRFFWFDGGQGDIQKENSIQLLNEDTLAAVQIALRPAPDRVATTRPKATNTDETASRDVPVRLATLELSVDADKLPKPDEPESPANGEEVFEPRLLRFKISPKNLPEDEIHLDAMPPPSGVETLPVYRFGSDAKSLQIGYAPASEKTLAFLRATLLTKEAAAKFNTLQFAVQAIYELGEEEVEMVLTAETHFQIHPRDRDFDPDKPGEVERGMGLFGDLSASDWADALFRPQTMTPANENKMRKLDETPAMNRLAFYAGRRFGNMIFPSGEIMKVDGTLTEASAAIDARAAMAQKITAFWAPYLEHCSVPAGKSDGVIHFSLGTIADPGTWQQAPDSKGRLSIVIPDSDRRGARRAFAIRPTGRYDDWIRSSTWHMRSKGNVAELGHFTPVERLDGALADDAALKQFVHATMPRTEPLEKPVILSARRLPKEEGLTGRGRFEVAVAHPADMTLGAANRRNVALLAPQEISLGLWREFAYGHWLTSAKMLIDAAGIDPEAWDPLAPFGAGAIAKPAADDADGNGPREAAETQLTSLRHAVPDAWQGTSVISFSRTPYFFRMHVLVHAAAGIVVSDHARTSFEEGFPYLSLPWEDNLRPHDKKIGYPHRTPSDRPNWAIHIRDGKRFLKIRLPLLRFIDAMPRADAELWFGKTEHEAEEGFSKIRPVAHLPEPETSYRIAIETIQPGTEGDDRLRQTQAQTFEVDIRPLSFDRQPDREARMYLAEPSGVVLGLVSGSKSEHLNPSTRDGMVWTLVLRLSQPTVNIAAFPITDVEATELARLPGMHGEETTFSFGHMAMFNFKTDDPYGDDEWNDRFSAMDAELRDDYNLAGLAGLLKLAFEKRFKGTKIREVLLPVPEHFWHTGTTPKTVKAFFGREIKRGISFLHLKDAPTTKEISPIFNRLEDDRRTLFLNWITERLFGPNRRLSVFAMRGSLPPASSLIRHELEDQS